MTDKFLSGDALSKAIQAIAEEDGAKMAVAFWGVGSDKWVSGANAKVIANLQMGGTNPSALRKVQAEIRQCSTLHAKVYIGCDRAIICSANASINGLALEGLQQAGWVEAGVLVYDLTRVSEWFEDLWNNGSRHISAADWKEAERRWKLRSTSYKPSAASFANFDPDASNLPLITYDVEGGWVVNEDAVEAAIEVKGPVAKRRVLKGLWITNPEDGQILADKWVFVWRRLANGRPGKGAPWFVQTSKVVVKGGFSWSPDAPQDVLLASERVYPPPFDPQEAGFRSAMREALMYPAFASLREDGLPEQPWFGPRTAITRRFWSVVKDIYLRDQSVTLKY